MIRARCAVAAHLSDASQPQLVWGIGGFGSRQLAEVNVHCLGDLRNFYAAQCGSNLERATAWVFEYLRCHSSAFAASILSAMTRTVVEPPPVPDFAQR